MEGLEGSYGVELSGTRCLSLNTVEDPPRSGIKLLFTV